MLEVKNLYCGYGGADIVKDMSFDLADGEILSVTGPNGCGKTTLLRAVSGLIPYHGGSIKIDGDEVKKLKRDKLSLCTALLSQTGAGGEYSDFTVFDTVMLGRYAISKNGSTTKLDREKTEYCLEKTGTAELRNKLITELSGGQLQRVFLARAFAQEPQLILLDEPANHLDLKHQLKLIELLKEWTDEKHSVIGIFHDINLAASLSDKMMVMSDGKKIMHGKTADICRSGKLSEVYGFDVGAYMRKALEIWK